MARPMRRGPSPKRAKNRAGTGVAGQLLIKISANSGGQAKRKMLVERRLDVKLGSALIVRRGVT